MKFLHKYGTRKNEIRRARKELQWRIALVFAVLVFFALMILVTQFRPRLSEESAQNLSGIANTGDPMNNPRLMTLRTEVEELLNEYSAKASQSDLGTDDLSLLEEAIEKQRKIILLRGSEIAPKADLRGLEELLTIYDEEMGEFLAAQSDQMEKEAEVKHTAGESDAGIKLLTRARNLQEQINNDYPRSPRRNPSQLHILNKKLLSWKTGPQARLADQLKDEALNLIASGNYGPAREKAYKALEIQRSLNNEFRNSRFASLSRLKEFEQALTQVETAEDNDLIVKLIAQAAAALDSGNGPLAKKLASEAETLQRRVIAKFSKKEALHEQNMAQIQKIKDTGASLPRHQKIMELRTATRKALIDQDMDTFQISVSEWLRETRSFKISFPDSTLRDEINDLEVTFLYDRKDEIPAILEMIYNNLLPVPGDQGKLLFRTEVPQILYSKVTGQNPSQESIPENPVDSLTWQEATNFTKQAGWILARPVALPGRELFGRALGEGDPKALASKAWSSETANRETQPVGSQEANELGFHDLLGNVSEWLAAPDEEIPRQVIAIGGAARDSRFRLATIPEEPREPFERNRFVGFRFIVIIQD